MSVGGTAFSMKMTDWFFLQAVNAQFEMTNAVAVSVQLLSAAGLRMPQ